MPTTATHTWTGQKLEPYMVRGPGDPPEMAVAITPSVHLAKGTVLGIITATGLYKAYATGNVDGSQTARGILAFDVDVDASGNITYTTTTGQVGGELGQTYKSVPMYIGGCFRTEDLVGLDAGAVTNLGGNLIFGTVTVGAVQFG